MPLKTRFVQRLRDRNLIQWGVAYLAAAWLALQILGEIADPWGIQEGTQRAAQILAVSGFLLTLVLAWFHGQTGQQRVRALEASMILMLIVATGFALRAVPNDRNPGPPTVGPPDGPVPGSIAVLPFENLSTDPQDEIFTDGFHEELIARLTRVRELKVISRTSVMEYRGARANLRDVGTRLGVARVVDGSVRWAGEAVRITVSLVDVATDATIWSETFDEEVTLNDLLNVQSSMATRIVSEVSGELSEEETIALQARPTESFDAYRAYQVGRSHVNRRTREGLTTAIGFYEQAIQLDSAYALAHVGLADALTLLVYYGWLTPEALTDARLNALKALELDPGRGAARTSLAEALWVAEWDWLRVEREFEQALAATPGYAQAHHWYAYYLAARGLHDQALAHMQMALALDPLSLIVNTWTGVVHRHADRVDEAIQQFRLTLELDDEFALAHGYLGFTYSTVGQHQEALEHLRTAAELDPEGTRILGMLGYAYGVAGRPDDALEVLERLRSMSQARYVSKYDVGLVYLGIGDTATGFEWLRQAAIDLDPMILLVNVEPALAAWRGTPGYRDLVRRLGLPDSP